MLSESVCTAPVALPRETELALTDITAEIVPGIELEKMGFAVRKTDRALLQELDTQLTATAAARDGV